MTLEFGQLINILATVVGFIVTVAVMRNDIKWVIRSFDAHEEEDNRRFTELKQDIAAVRNRQDEA